MHRLIHRPIPLLACLLALLGASSALHAQGGPPFITDDPGTPGDGHWEINTAWTREHRPGETANELPLVDINYGVGPRIQLKFELPFLVRRGDGEPRQSAFGDSLFGVKWRFHDAGEGGGWALSTYPQVGVRTPGSSASRRGLVDGGNTLIAPIEVVRELGDWSVNLDGGRVFRSRDADNWFAGIVVGHDVGKHCQLAAELHAECDPHFAHASRGPLVANVGGHLELDENHTLLFSIGREIRNRTEPAASLLLYLGWQLHL